MSTVTPQCELFAAVFCVVVLPMFCWMDVIGSRLVVVIDTVHCVLVWTFVRRDSEL